MDYEPRTYRTLHSGQDMVHLRIVVGETDLDIAVDKESYHEKLVQETKQFIIEKRAIVEEYIQLDPLFLKALKPHLCLPGADEMIKQMCAKTKLANVGPMAAVAGLFSEMVGNFLAESCREIIVENGGDIWLKSNRTRNVAIYAGGSILSCQIGIEVAPQQMPLGICTSSGTVGHSLSFGKADAVVVLSPSAVLADAVATAAANIIQSSDDLEKAVRFACGIEDVTGAVAVIAESIAVFGEVRLIPLSLG